MLVTSLRDILDLLKHVSYQLTGYFMLHERC
jgi:hypothetical protein